MTDAPRWHLSGFGDEIDADPRVQVAVLQALGARHLEVRSAWGTNVADLTDAQVRELAQILDAAEHRVSAIGSPIGKVDISEAAGEVARLRRIAEIAHTLDTRYVRIFSFYRAEGVTPEQIRDDVIAALTELAGVAEDEGLVLLHENEKDIYGDTPDRVADLARHVSSPAFRLAWDAANFVQVGARPHTDGWAELAPHVEYLQVKDADLATGAVRPAGDGDGEVEATVRALAASGYAGFASLEPHLTEAGRMGGFSGPAAFGVAARAFARITDRVGVQLV
ncbi:Xylose isomerase domain protein TIM barrel [Beutenbergia cavernae DSM 12333]|uniref:Xylose isomerase domain protein TIM barrel n=1 Tax=Beutenbergia cavernae (strain ATCC BAA-8 / DSM 12333 / CCUG 43141 / JCM 11478 / NBRC 16432 / NCIMB 13614 / HKI 0122) TaxID=471853 RepID=C5C1E7_BEUC1|nr:sugar phosphate isomerase/epimerase family protein [Beutenbergia cavernae]ACQ81557.1 Xylose isomerase domain protein TIM barrel [Beutenbergia cavernae DSM 12333]